MSLKKILPILILIFLENGSYAQNVKVSDHNGVNIWVRSSNREASRWTLQDWLEQKDRSRIMDLWLNMNSPSPYEFEVGLWQNSYSTSISSPASQTNYISTQGNISAYAQIFGLTAEYENNIKEQYNDVIGKFDLRLMGNSIQNTNLTFHLGQRTRAMSYLATNPQVKNSFAELSLCMHLSKFFGITGGYRVYQPATDPTINQSVAGTLSEGGLFIDFKAVRVFGSWFEDLQVNTPTTGSSTSTIRTGYRSGVQIFF